MPGISEDPHFWPGSTSVLIHSISCVHGTPLKFYGIPFLWDLKMHKTLGEIFKIFVFLVFFFSTLDQQMNNTQFDIWRFYFMVPSQSLVLALGAIFRGYAVDAQTLNCDHQVLVHKQKQGFHYMSLKNRIDWSWGSIAKKRFRTGVHAHAFVCHFNVS